MFIDGGQGVPFDSGREVAHFVKEKDRLRVCVYTERGDPINRLYLSELIGTKKPAKEVIRDFERMSKPPKNMRPLDLPGYTVWFEMKDPPAFTRTTELWLEFERKREIKPQQQTVPKSWGGLVRDDGDDTSRGGGTGRRGV